MLLLRAFLAPAHSSTSLLRSPVFDPKTGFGGAAPNGDPVPDGPFSSFNLTYGPRNTINSHRLTRNLNATFLPFLSEAQVLNTTKQPTFERFWTEIEGRPLTSGPKLHDAGHRLIGGDMSDTYSSSGDPLFFLHHANLDRIWWGWQMEDPKRRLYAISGRSTYQPPFKNVTLDWPLSMAGVAPHARIRDVMDIAGGYMCYRYV
ncbi:hypothetical protein DXG01_011023 [Tephrocybe rancida]|nr:hypothetical protein DXG01_011023 [Tephrocybe rancida]